MRTQFILSNFVLVLVNTFCIKSLYLRSNNVQFHSWHPVTSKEVLCDICRCNWTPRVRCPTPLHCFPTDGGAPVRCDTYLERRSLSHRQTGLGKLQWPLCSPPSWRPHFNWQLSANVSWAQGLASSWTHIRFSSSQTGPQQFLCLLLIRGNWCYYCDSDSSCDPPPPPGVPLLFHATSDLKHVLHFELNHK